MIYFAPNLDAVVVQAHGEARGNPGIAGSGAVVLDAESRSPLGQITYSFEEITTSDVAAYTALILGLRKAYYLGAERVRVEMDSKLVIQQMSARKAMKCAELRVYRSLARRGERHFSSVAYRWIPARQNELAVRLAHEATAGGKSHQNERRAA